MRTGGIDAYDRIMRFCTRTLPRLKPPVFSEGVFLSRLSRLVWFLIERGTDADMADLEAASFMVAYKMETRESTASLLKQLMAESGISDIGAVTRCEVFLATSSRGVFSPSSTAAELLDDMLEKGGIDRLSENPAAAEVFKRNMISSSVFSGPDDGVESREAAIAVARYKEVADGNIRPRT